MKTFDLAAAGSRLRYMWLGMDQYQQFVAVATGLTALAIAFILFSG